MQIFKGLTSRLGIMGELLTFLWQRKLWWLIPMVLVLLLFGLLLIFAQTSSIAPFIYTLF
jgi:drug/metabolite transporter superfamily protein YnfA